MGRVGLPSFPQWDSRRAACDGVSAGVPNNSGTGGRLRGSASHFRGRGSRVARWFGCGRVGEGVGGFCFYFLRRRGIQRSDFVKESDG